VKNVTFSHCKLSCTKVFTPWPRTPLKKNAMPGAESKKQRPQNYQNGREATPLFRLSAAQKVRWVAPALVNKTRQLHCRIHRREYRTVVRRSWRRDHSGAEGPHGEIIFVAQRYNFPSQH
jgi:hypothetical protein